MKKTLSAIAVAVVAAIALGATMAQSGVVVLPASDGQHRIIQRGATIRVGSSVYIHTNGAHAAVGVTRTQLVNKCYLRAYLDTANGEQLISITVDEDEALSKLGIRAGGSGGGGYVNIYFYRADGRPVCANNKTLGAYANIWLETEHLAPPGVPVDDLDPAPSVTPPLEQQQRSVPSDARATIKPPAR